MKATNTEIEQIMEDALDQLRGHDVLMIEAAMMFQSFAWTCYEAQRDCCFVEAVRIADDKYREDKEYFINRTMNRAGR